MIDPVQFPSPAGRLGERLAAYGERVDADLAVAAKEVVPGEPADGWFTAEG